MVVYRNKTKFKLSHTKPLAGRALRDSLAQTVRGFVLLIRRLRLQSKQTITMKKILYVFVLIALLVPSLSFAALPSGCKAEYKFSPLTGQRCVDTPTVTDCAPGDLFSVFTGRSCSVAQSQPIITQTTVPVSHYSQTDLQEFNQSVQAFQQQIIDIKAQYYIDIRNIDQTAGFLAQADGLKQQALVTANAKIAQIKLKIQQLQLDYQISHPNTLPIIPIVSPICPITNCGTSYGLPLASA